MSMPSEKLSGSQGTRFRGHQSKNDSNNVQDTADAQPSTDDASRQSFSSPSAASSQVTLTGPYSPSASQITLTGNTDVPSNGRHPQAQYQSTLNPSTPYSIDTPTTSRRLSREVNTFNPRSAGGGNAWSDVGNTPTHTSSVDRADFIEIMNETRGMTSEEVKRYLKERNGGLQGADGKAIMQGAKGSGYMWKTGDFRGTM